MDQPLKGFQLFRDSSWPTPSIPASDLILSRAKAVESAVLTEYKGTTAAYKTKIRQIFVNLKDKNNPGLRESVISGDLSAQKFAKMTSQVRS